MSIFRIPLMTTKPLLKKVRSAVEKKRKAFKKVVEKSKPSKEFKALNKARGRMYQARDYFTMLDYGIMKDKKIPKEAKKALQRTMDKVTKGRKKTVTTMMDPKYLFKKKNKKGGMITYKKGGFNYGS
jgi:hypothetical protein